EYRLTLHADVVLVRSGEAEPVLERRVQGETTFDLAGDLASAKLDSLPIAARDLAHDIVECVVEYW
ncbi:hypothetical protein ACFLSJ_05680, partial [Verrucomicrobiota bacterium]